MRSQIEENFGNNFAPHSSCTCNKKNTQQKKNDDDKLWCLRLYANVEEKIKVHGLVRKYSINLHNLSMSEQGVYAAAVN